MVYTCQQRQDGPVQYRYSTEPRNNKTQPAVIIHHCYDDGDSSDGDSSDGDTHHSERKHNSTKYKIGKFLKPRLSSRTWHDISKEGQEEECKLHPL